MVAPYWAIPTPSAPAPNPHITPAADVIVVMREQLEYLIEHATSPGYCGCNACVAYNDVRAILLGLFKVDYFPNVR
jgi:hypothetical protein